MLASTTGQVARTSRTHPAPSGGPVAESPASGPWSRPSPSSSFRLLRAWSSVRSRRARLPRLRRQATRPLRWRSCDNDCSWPLRSFRDSRSGGGDRQFSRYFWSVGTRPTGNASQANLPICAIFDSHANVHRCQLLQTVAPGVSDKIRVRWAQAKHIKRTHTVEQRIV